MTLSALVLSLLALGPKACPEPPDEGRDEGAQPERDDRNERIADLETRIETLEAERDRALEGVELVQAQLDRAIQRIARIERDVVAAARPLYAAPQALAQQAYVNMLNQMPGSLQQASAAQQMAMYAQAQQAMQNAFAPEHCNCVPARHDMLRPRRT